MQIHFTFTAEKEFCIPMSYNYQLQSALYSKLEEIGLSDFWHDEGFGVEQTYKLFSFSPLKGPYRIIDKKICFDGEMSFEIRSPIFEFCDEVQRSFEVNPTIKLFDTELETTRIAIANKHINYDSAVFSAISPIILHSHLPDNITQYYFPYDDCFIDRLLKNYRNKFNSVYENDAPDIDIKILDEGKKCVTKYKNIWLTGNKCVLALKGDPLALEFIYNTGLGEKNSQGFGFLTLK